MNHYWYLLVVVLASAVIVYTLQETEPNPVTITVLLSAFMFDVVFAILFVIP